MQEQVKTTIKDKLLNRMAHILRTSGSRGLSVPSIANRLKSPNQDEIQRRVDFMVSKGVVSAVDSGRVYNGLPVMLYVWVAEAGK